MKREKLEQYLSTLQGAEKNHPFGPDALVFKVMGKMFAYVSEKEGTPIVTIKCIPLDGEILVEQFESITPGYYMNKKHWITVSPANSQADSLADEISENMLIDLANKSYELVVGKLTIALVTLLRYSIPAESLTWQRAN